MKKTQSRGLSFIPIFLCCMVASLCATAHNGPMQKGRLFDSLVTEGATKLLALMQANGRYEVAGQRDKMQYVVTVGFGTPAIPGDSTLVQRNASGADGYFEPGNLVHTIISDSLRKWNLTSTVKCYMLYVNGLFFVLDKTTKVDSIKGFFEQPDAGFVLGTNQLKVAHSDITNAIFNRVATSDLLRRTTVLFSIGAYRTNAVFKVRLNTNGTPTDSTWIKTHLLLTSYPKAGNLGETDERKKLISIVHNAMLYEKPAFSDPQAALNDERMVIGRALKRVQRHQQILTLATPDALDNIFKEFELADYMALTLPERVHALKVMAGGAMGNNLYNSREAYAVLMVRHTPDAQQLGLLNALMAEKATGSSDVLLKDLISRIDNGHFVNESNDLDEFITSIAKFIYRKMPPGENLSIDSILIKRRTIGIKPGFWFGDDVYQNISANGTVRLENRERRVTMSVPAYDYVYLCFNGNFTIGDKQYRKDERVLVPAIIAQLVFNNHNASKIKTGLKTVFDLALLLTGVGELRLALEAKNAWMVAKAIWNMGWGISDFFINGALAEKLSETESGRKFLLWYNRVQLVAGGIGMGISIYDIRQGFKQSKQELADDLADNKLRRELEYGTSEVQVTNAEKDDIINNLKKEEDEMMAKLNLADNAGNYLAYLQNHPEIQAALKKLKDNNLLKNMGECTETHMAALTRYTENGGIVLTKMRDGSETVIGPVSFSTYENAVYNTMVDALEKLRKTNRLVTGQVIRGRTYSQADFNVLFNSGGTNVSLKGMVSCTRNEEVAIDFLSRSGTNIIGAKVKVIMKIKSKNGVDIDDISDWGVNLVSQSHPGELVQREVLLEEGVFKMIGGPVLIKIDNGVPWYEVNLEELGIPLRAIK